MAFENLNPKQRTFAEHYALNHSASKAAVAAGYSEKTARQKGWELKNEPGVKEYIEHLEAEALAELNLTRHRLLSELEKLAFSNIKDYVTFGPGGVILRDSEDIPEELLAAVSEVSEKPGKEGSAIAFKLHSKLDAIGKIAAMIGHNAPVKTESEVKVTDTSLEKTQFSIKQRAPAPVKEKPGKEKPAA